MYVQYKKITLPTKKNMIDIIFKIIIIRIFFMRVKKLLIVRNQIRHKVCQKLGQKTKYKVMRLKNL